MRPSLLSDLREHAQRAARRAHVPFSGQPAAAALLLSDGVWVPGVRVESASFSLTIAPVLNAFTTAAAKGRADVIAAAFSHPPSPTDRAFLEEIGPGPFEPVGDHGYALRKGDAPAVGPCFDPFLHASLPPSAEDGVALASATSEHALVPASHFPVGCVLQIGGALIPGVNVEPQGASRPAGSWSHVLCAERNALGTACSYGRLGAGAEAAGTSADANGTPEADAATDGPPVLYLACPDDPEGSPCGACRQLLVELVPNGVLWMDRASAHPARTSPADLLPGSFRGAALPRSAPDA